MAKMSVHRGLKELKTLNSRISKVVNSSQFVGVRKGNANIINGQTIDNFQKGILSSYDSVMALIQRRAQIKSAIVLSNAGVPEGVELRRIKVGDLSLTVAEAIEYKSSVEYELGLLSVLNSQYAAAMKTIEKENAKAEARFDEYVKTMLGNEAKQKLTPAELESFRTKFNEVNEYSLIDPLGIKARIDELDKKIDSFLTEVDTVLSEDNGTTFIEVAG